MLDKRLKIFQMVCELNSFSGAAASLGMSQPNATQQLKKLEEDLGVTLFERDTRHIRLTEAGKLLQKELRPLTAVSDHLERTLAGLKDGIQNYAIGGTLTAGNFVLPDLMGFFMRKNEKIHLHLHVENTTSIAEKVQQHFLDLGLVEGPFNRNLFLYQKLMNDELMAAGHPNYIGKRFSLREYLSDGGKLILREQGSGTRYHFDQFCMRRKINVPQSSILTVESFEAIKQMVILRSGVTVISPLACKLEIKQSLLRCIPMEEGPIQREFNFIYNASEHLPFVEQFIRFSLKTVSGKD